MVHDEIESGTFHFDVLLAAVAFCYWLRLLVMLELTWTFGPLIAIISRMMADMMIFFGLFVIQLIAFGCVAILTFGQVKAYENLYTATVVLFQTACGTWSLDIYEPLGERENIGIVFHMAMISMNMLLILNLLIAIMSDTYSKFSELKAGLYFTGIIRAIPVYQYDNKYAALITAVPPFNILVLPLIPVLMMVKDEAQLKRINLAALQVIYSPVAFIGTLVFSLGNFLLLPVAYGKCLTHKFLLVLKTRSGGAVKRLVTFTLIGFPMMLITTIVDCYYFLVYSFRWDQWQSQEPFKYNTIKKQIFLSFLKFIKEIALQQTSINVYELIAMVSERTQNIKHMRILLFGCAEFSARGYVDQDR